MTFPTPHPTLPAASPAVVWREYRRTGDVRLRDRLVFTLAPLVRHAGARTPETAAQGMAVLLEAVEAYTPEHHGPLEAYVWARVHAAIR